MPIEIKELTIKVSVQESKAAADIFVFSGKSGDGYTATDDLFHVSKGYTATDDLFRGAQGYTTTDELQIPLFDFC